MSGEAALARADIPPGLRGIFASRQAGWYVDMARDIGAGWIRTAPGSTFTLKARVRRHRPRHRGGRTARPPGRRRHQLQADERIGHQARAGARLGLRPVQQSERLRASARLLRHVLLSIAPSVWDADDGAPYPALSGEVARRCLRRRTRRQWTRLHRPVPEGGCFSGGRGRGPRWQRGGGAEWRVAARRAPRSSITRQWRSTASIGRRACTRRPSSSGRESSFDFPSIARRCGYLRLAHDAGRGAGLSRAPRRAAATAAFPRNGMTAR